MTRATISTVSPAHHAAVGREIERRLLLSLAKLNAQSTNTTVVMTAESDDGQLIGGVLGSTSYGWFLVKVLWVSEDHRNAGIGRNLMVSAEEQAREMGCHSAWLDTSNPHARDFYLRLGYSDFGCLENGSNHEPVEHHRWFMQKKL